MELDQAEGRYDEAKMARGMDATARPPEAAQAVSMAHGSAEVLHTAYAQCEKALMALGERLESAGILAPELAGSLNGSDRPEKAVGTEFRTAHAQEIEKIHHSMQDGITSIQRLQGRIESIHQRIEI